MSRVVDWKKKHEIDWERQTMRFENECVLVTGVAAALGSIRSRIYEEGHCWCCGY